MRRFGLGTACPLCLERHRGHDFCALGSLYTTETGNPPVALPHLLQWGRHHTLRLQKTRSVRLKCSHRVLLPISVLIVDVMFILRLQSSASGLDCNSTCFELRLYTSTEDLYHICPTLFCSVSLHWVSGLCSSRLYIPESCTHSKRKLLLSVQDIANLPQRRMAVSFDITWYCVLGSILFFMHWARPFCVLSRWIHRI